MSKILTIGTGPICKITSKKCNIYPGYKYKNKTKKGCIIGNKINCEFDRDLFKKTWLYNELLKSKLNNDLIVNIDNYIPEYRWFGTSPHCTVNNLDCIAKGYFPLLKDKWGSGLKCIIGNKILGIKPFSNKQLDYINKYKDKAKKYINLKHKIGNILKKYGKKAIDYISEYFGIPHEVIDGTLEIGNKIIKNNE